MKLKVYILAVLFFAISISYSQGNLHLIKYYTSTDSIDVDPYSFFPMQVGNFWQYAFLNEIVKEELVTGDSLLENNFSLFWINDFPTYLIDKNYTVFGWHPSGEIVYMDCLFKLNSDLGEEWFVRVTEQDSTRGIIRKVESIFEAEYLGITTTFKEIFEYARDGDNGDYLRHKFLLGAGLGIVLKRNDSMVEPPEYLLSAIIDGDTLGTIVGVENDYDDYLPSSTKLFQNYPNPFNPETIITYSLSISGPTSLVIYNLLGERIETLIDQYQSIGNYSYKLNLSGLPSGIYIYTLNSGNIISSKKMLYLK